MTPPPLAAPETIAPTPSGQGVLVGRFVTHLRAAGTVAELASTTAADLRRRVPEGPRIDRLDDACARLHARVEAARRAFDPRSPDDLVELCEGLTRAVRDVQLAVAAR